MPLQRSNNSSLGVQQVDGVVAKGAAAPDVGDAADADEVEDERYCFCGGVSYGEMIACDDDNCEREWVRSFDLFQSLWLMKWPQFHLACVGMTSIPQGQWYCGACAKKRNAHRPSRGGRRKNANGRSAKTS